MPVPDWARLLRCTECGALGILRCRRRRNDFAEHVYKLAAHPVHRIMSSSGLLVADENPRFVSEEILRLTNCTAGSR